MKRLLLLCILSFSTLIGQDFPALKPGNIPVGSDSVKNTSRPGLKYSFKQLTPASLTRDSIFIKLNYEIADERPVYYSPENIIPSNPLFLDTRTGSYYTPRMVSDKLDQIMNRPRADSFLPLPVAAVLAARLAAKYIDIGEKIKITARDYIIGGDQRLILNALWKNPGCSSADLYTESLFRYHGSLNTLESLLRGMQSKKLVKVRKIENDNDRFYAAQSKQVVLNLLENGMTSPELTPAEKDSIFQMLRIIRNDPGVTR